MAWNQSKSNVLVVGHRGYAARYPENTMLSFEKALDAGVDGIEMDLRFSSDGVPVIIHDSKLDRTTNAKGDVSSFSLSELKKLDAGRGEKIPTFEEFLDFVSKTDTMLNVEIKDYKTELVDTAIKMLNEYKLEERFVITCWNASITSYAHKQHGAKTQGFIKEYLTNYREDSYSHYYSVGIQMKELTKTRCDEFYEMGIDAWGWCPDTDESIQTVMQSGCSLITCNEPEPALRILKANGLHK